MTTTLRSWVLFGLIWVCVTHGPAIGQEAPVREPNADGLAVSEKARDIHFSGMLFDGHNDLPWTLRAKAGSSFDSADIRQPQPQFHTDIPGLQAGGVKAQFWSVYVPVSTRLEASSLLTTLEQIDLVHEMCRRYPDVFEVALTADDVERIVAEGKIASLMGVEGGHSIENSLENLRRLFDRGARYMTLTHSRNVEWADSATDEPQHQGLTEFGREVVREMNRLGMLVDLSHVSPKTMHDTLDETKAPVI
ncbi:MAG TPA: membrane dipeptidase, partial [Pirellulaceae bacterium]|nr:membrane dipeptidase [Pirellulaceae bacterium]